MSSEVALAHDDESWKRSFEKYWQIMKYALCCCVLSCTGPHTCVTCWNRREVLWTKMAPAVGGPQGYTPPEGGWGWMVVIGAFISIGFSYAFPKSITVFFKEIEVIFNVTSSQVSWISSIMLACMYGGGELQTKIQPSVGLLTLNIEHIKEIYRLNQFLALSATIKDLFLQCSVKSQSIAFCSKADLQCHSAIMTCPQRGHRFSVIHFILG